MWPCCVPHCVTLVDITKGKQIYFQKEEKEEKEEECKKDWRPKRVSGSSYYSAKQCPSCLTTEMDQTKIKEKSYGFVGQDSWERLACFEHKPEGSVCLTQYSKKKVEESYILSLRNGKNQKVPKQKEYLYPFMWLRHWLQFHGCISLEVHKVAGDGECWLHAVRYLLAKGVKNDEKNITVGIKPVNREEFNVFLISIKRELAVPMEYENSFLPLYYLLYLARFLRTDILCINIVAKKGTTYERYTCPTEYNVETFIILMFYGNHFNPIFGKDESLVCLYEFEKIKYRVLYELFAEIKIKLPDDKLPDEISASPPRVLTWRCIHCNKTNDDGDQICVECSKTWVCRCSRVRVRDKSMSVVEHFGICCDHCYEEVSPITVSSRSWKCLICSLENKRADTKCQACFNLKGTRIETLKLLSNEPKKRKTNNTK